jgi:dephospho-CoA kinase
MTRNNLSLDEAQARIATQWPTEEKVARADFVIRTDGTHAETEAQVTRIYSQLRV